jgi:tRNA threonylcarbamoyladenosine biosynthesis protein TsaB
MTRLLAIETSAEACSVALHIDGATREFHEHAPMKHAELLLPAVRSLLDEGGLALGGLDAIAFGRGPGSFTSLRIGIGVVQGLAWGAELPVVPVSSLAAVAMEAASRSREAATTICVALDARMQEVYHGNFVRYGAERVGILGEERVGRPDTVAIDRDGPFVAAGNAFERFAELQPLADAALLCLPELVPRASVIARLALGWLQDNEPLPAAQAQPVYLRNKVAEKPSGD